MVEIKDCGSAVGSGVLAGGAGCFFRAGVLLIASTLAGRDHKAVYLEVRAGSQVLEGDGGQGRNRTTDTRIFSRRGSSHREFQLPQKRLVARIANDPAHQPVALYLRYAAVALGIGALEPLEGQVGLAAEGMHFGDLIGRSLGELALQSRERRVGLAAPAERVKCKRQS